MNKIRNIRPKTDISTPLKVSWTEPSHEWRSNNGMASTIIVSTCQEHGCSVKYFEKDQWNFSHLWKCFYKIIIKEGSFIIRKINISNWSCLYPEAEIIISYMPYKFKEEW